MAPDAREDRLIESCPASARAAAHITSAAISPGTRPYHECCGVLAGPRETERSDMSMVALSRKQVLVFLIILVSFLVALAISMTIIRAANPGVWNHIFSFLPDVQSHY
jgi:hypothetical protein